MKKVMSFCLCAAMLMLAAFNYPTHAKEDERLYLNGKAMSTDQFEEEYCIKQTVVASDELIESLSDVSLLISDMQYYKGIFSATCLVKDGEEYYQFKESGPLGRGYKEEVSDSKSIVWGCEAEQKGPEILMFELTYGDFLNKNRYASQKVTANNALRIYILNGDTLYMFEQAIPEMLAWIDDLELDKNHNADRDTFAWTFAFVPPAEDLTVTVEDFLGFDPSDRRRELRDNRIFWTAETPVRATATVAGNYFEYTSLPMGYYDIRDVGLSDTTWMGEFYVGETVMMDGNQVAVENPIRYSNVEISMVCGRSTQFLKDSMGGKIGRTSIFRPWNPTLDILSTCSQWWAIGQTIVECFQTFINSGQSLTLNSGSPIELHPSGTTGIDSTLPSGYYLCNNSYTGDYYNPIYLTDNSHYLTCHATLNSTLSSSGSDSTVGAVWFRWAYCVSGGNLTQKSIRFSKSYSSYHY